MSTLPSSASATPGPASVSTVSMLSNGAPVFGLKGRPNRVPKGLVNFWRWWRQELASAFAPLIEKYWVDRSACLDIVVQTSGEISPPLKLAGRDVRLLVEHAHVLQKVVSYPAVVEENLAAVIENDLDRQTPFTLSQVYLAHRVIRRIDAADGVARIEVELTIILKRSIDAVLLRLRNAGASIYSIGVVNDQHATELLPISARPARRLSRRQLINLSLLAIFSLLVIGAVAVPVFQAWSEVRQLAPLVEKARNEAEATRKIEAEYQRQLDEYQLAVGKKYQAFPVIDIVEELSKLSPDTTWLQSLEMKAPPGGKVAKSTREIQIIGEAASASKMIELLEQSPLLQNTTQRAQTTRGAQPNTERFQIATELRPRSQPALVDLLDIVPTAPTIPATATTTAPAAITTPTTKPAPAAAPPVPTSAPVPSYVNPKNGASK